jgi:hypothetical protein
MYGKNYPFKIKKDIRDNLLAEKGVDFVPLACREIITVIISLRIIPWRRCDTKPAA